jgi:hypothetical protein
MRGIIQDQVSHKFIEGPINYNIANRSLQEENNEQTAYHADLSQGFKMSEFDNIYDQDMPYYKMNERYD